MQGNNADTQVHTLDLEFRLVQWTGRHPQKVQGGWGNGGALVLSSDKGSYAWSAASFDTGAGLQVFEPRRFVELRKKDFVTQALSAESLGMGLFYTLNVFWIQFYLGGTLHAQPPPPPPPPPPNWAGLHAPLAINKRSVRTCAHCIRVHDAHPEFPSSENFVWKCFHLTSRVPLAGMWRVVPLSWRKCVQNR